MCLYPIEILIEFPSYFLTYSSTKFKTGWLPIGTYTTNTFPRVDLLVYQFLGSKFEKWTWKARANYPILHQFRVKSNRRISKGLISESKFRFETAGSIRLTLIKMHLIKSKECNRRANYPIPRLNCTTRVQSRTKLFKFSMLATRKISDATA